MKNLLFLFLLMNLKLVYCQSDTINLKLWEINKKSVFDIHKSGKESIPLLLNKIDDTLQVLMPTSSPRSSYFIGESNLGYFYCYLIEWILAKDSLIYSDEDSLFLFGNWQNYIYNRGMIYVEDKTIADTDDLPIIKEIYEKWWLENKHKSLEYLRSEYKDKRKPLSQSVYYWR